MEDISMAILWTYKEAVVVCNKHTLRRQATSAYQSAKTESPSTTLKMILIIYSRIMKMEFQQKEKFTTKKKKTLTLMENHYLRKMRSKTSSMQSHRSSSKRQLMVTKAQWVWQQHLRARTLNRKREITQLQRLTVSRKENEKRSSVKKKKSDVRYVSRYFVQVIRSSSCNASTYSTRAVSTAG